MPPFASKVWEYGEPTVPPGRLVVTIPIGPPAVTVSVNGLETEPFAPSVRVMVKLKEPVAVGVPVTRPVLESSVRPGATWPGTGNVTIAGNTSHLYGGVPPEPES